MSNLDLQRTYRRRVIIFLACVAAGLAASWFAWQVAATLSRLDVVEAERDGWQRPNDVIAALAIRDGGTVADLGCGSGYFTLRISSKRAVRVLAEDIRTLPLLFLRLRAILSRRSNIGIIHGTADDPKLPPASVDAVLIANTYHEFAHPRAILNAVRGALRPRGRLVILDRAPGAGGDPATHHEIARAAVEDEVRNAGFTLLERRDPFIEPPGDEPWWLIVATKSN